MDAVTQEVLRHLTRGWHGFVRILTQATAAGISVPPEEITRLERMQSELADVIAQQRRLADK